MMAMKAMTMKMKMKMTTVEVVRGTQREIPRWFVAAFVTFTLARIVTEAGFVRLPPMPKRKLIAWHEPGLPGLDLDDDARRLAQEQGKPLLIEFTADWCAPCRRMEEETLQDEGVADRIARGFVAMRVVDSEDPSVGTPAGAALREEFGVTAFPTLVVVFPGGAKPVVRRGYLPPAEMRRFLDAARLTALAARNAGARRPTGRPP